MILKSIYYLIARHYWDIGFVSIKDGVLEGEWSYSFIKHNYKDRLFADPFILEVNDEIIELLVEEYRYKNKRGRIAKLTIDRKTNKVIDLTILLDLETHLSFPAIFRVNDEIYVYPENAASGKNKVYRYNKESNRLDYISVLIDKPISDGVIIPYFEKPCIIATCQPNSTSNLIEFYEATTFLGEYSHVQTVQIEPMAGRGAGDVFMYNGMLLRPGQLWTRELGYGAGLSFQKIEKIDGRYVVSELFQKLPPHKYQGMHTFNGYKGFYVVDCRRYKRPVIAKFQASIVRFAKKIMGRL